MAAVAISQIMDRTLGKAAETPQGDDASSRLIDMTVLSAPERNELLAALATVRRLREVAIGRVARSGRVIEAQVEPMPPPAVAVTESAPA